VIVLDLNNLHRSMEKQWRGLTLIRNIRIQKFETFSGVVPLDEILEFSG